MPLVAGVDSSTSATKIEVRDLDSGRVVASGAAPHPSTQPPRSEQEPEAWWTAFQTAWLLEQLAGGRAAWAEACGSIPLASFTITKVSWLRRREPEAWARLAHVVLPHDWLTYRLTGRLTSDRGDASGTGYWSAARGEYRLDLLALVDPAREWGDAVPTVLGPKDAAGEWQDAAVAVGTGDNMAGALGVGLRSGDAAISIGTSGTVFAVSELPSADPSGIVAGFADATGRFLPLVCTLNATKVTEAVRRLLGADHDELDHLALEAEPGAGGLTLLPYLDGERTPDRPSATGVLAGLRSDVERDQLARAAVEGVVCGLLDGFDALGSFAAVDQRLFVVGGGARSRAYRQVLADLSGRAVLVPRDEQQVAAGACVQAAALASGEEPADIADRWQLGAGDLVEPGPGADAAADVRAAYADLRDTTEL